MSIWGIRISLLPALVMLAAAFAQGQTWSQDGPAARYHTSGIYDVSTDRLVVFGGEQTAGVPLGDVWASPKIVAAGQMVAKAPYVWTQLFPTGTAPAARFGQSAVYDSVSNRMIVFGGATSTTACLNDVWLLDNANSAIGTPDWIPITPSGTPPAARQNFNAVYDPTSNSMIVFGGSNCAGKYFSDVWVLSNANGEVGTPTWTQLSPAGVGPSNRESSSAIYDSINNVLTVYAGDAGSGGMSDVWTLSNANGQGGTPTWTMLTPTGTAPSARTGMSSVYDSTNNLMIMYGGINTLTSTRFLGDTWVLTFPNGIGGIPSWTLQKVTGTAPQMRFHIAFFNAPDDDLVIWGGLSQILPSAQNDRVFILSKANGL